jgi:hypothetical protein
MAVVVTTDTGTDARTLEQILFDTGAGLCSLEDTRNTSHMQRTLARLMCRKGASLNPVCSHRIYAEQGGGNHQA